LRFVHALLCLAILALACGAWAEDVQPAAPVTPEAGTGAPAGPTATEPAQPPVPTVTPETKVFKRTPAVNGQIEPGEWDEYFTFEYGSLRVWTYVDWDDDCLYVASKSTAPTDLLVTLDANGDGWFHGSDNYEFVARRGQEGESPTLSVSRYESQGTPGGGGAPLAAAEAAAFTMKAGSAPDSYVLELAIPRSAAQGLELRGGKKISLKVAIGVGSPDVQWIPPAPLGEVQTIELVSLKSSVPPSLKLTVDVKDKRLTPGEDLIAKIHVRNTDKAVATVDSVVVGGEGKTAKLLGSQLFRMEGIDPGKSFTCTFHTPISRSAPPGSAALGVEVRSGDERIASSLLSFDIVPTCEVRLDLGSQPIARGQVRRIAVVIKNNSQRGVYGRVRLSLPDGWVFQRSRGVKEFDIRQEDGEQAVSFRVKAPDNAQGKTPVLAEVQTGGRTVSVSGVLEVK